MRVAPVSLPGFVVGTSSTLTRDTYTSVSPRLAKEAAEMIPRKAS
jgi:hypothetical protein